MSRAKRKKMKLRLKRKVNELVTAGVTSKPNKELRRLCKLYNVDLNMYHWAKFRRIDA